MYTDLLSIWLTVSNGLNCFSLCSSCIEGAKIKKNMIIIFRNRLAIILANNSTTNHVNVVNVPLKDLVDEEDDGG